MFILCSLARILPLKHNYIYYSCLRRIHTAPTIRTTQRLFNNNEPVISTIHKRWYRPDKHIDWVGIRRKWRVQQLLQKKKKLKNHPRVALRFRLTRFGWERLRTGRNARKHNMTRTQYKKKMRTKYVSRNDLKKLDRQMPGYRLRIRDPPINKNPNILKTRRIINNYFG